MMRAYTGNEGEDVYSLVLHSFRALGKRCALDDDELFAGLGYLRQDPPLWFPWADAALMIERLAVAWDKAGLSRKEIGLCVLSPPAIGQLLRPVATGVQMRTMVGMGFVYGVSRTLRCIRSNAKDLPDGRLEINLSIMEGFAPSAGLLEMCLGAVEAWPEVFGGGEVEVDELMCDRTCVMKVTFPVRPSLLQRFMLYIRGWFSTPVALTALATQAAELNDQARELREALAVAHSAQLDAERSRDIAERSLMVKQEFLSTISHELRTPLHGILGASAELRSETSPITRKHLHDTLDASASGLTRIIEGMLELNQLACGAVLSVPEPVEVRPLLQAVLAPFERAAARNGLIIRRVVDSTVPTLLSTDGLRLEQIVRHVLDNAIRFTEVGSLSVSVSMVGGELVVRVRDTGPGMHPDVLEAVLQPLTQADTSSTRQHGGTGLGLAISAGLCKALGGSFELESALGKGTEVRFALPAVKMLRPLPREVTVDDADEPVRVLVAEDNRVNQMLIRRMLERIGCEVVVAADGVEAVEAASCGVFDLVLMDCEMPRMNGYDATRSIRALQSHGGTPIVAVTAYVSDEDRLRCLEAGMNEVLPKPVGVERLTDAVARWTERATMPAEFVSV